MMLERPVHGQEPATTEAALVFLNNCAIALGKNASASIKKD